MLTRFFKKSKPINFLSVTVLTVLFYGLFNFVSITEDINGVFVLKKIGCLFIFLVMLFILNFVSVKNKFTGRHTYVLFLFFLFCIAVPYTLINNTSVLAGFFIILGLRRTINMHTGKGLSKKIFDAVFCFTVAGLFFPPTLIFILLPLFSILYYSSKNYKHWLIPIPAILSVLILQTVFSLLRYNQFYNPIKLITHQSILFTHNTLFIQYAPLGIIVLFTIWALFHVIVQHGKETRDLKKTKQLLFLATLCGLYTIVFSGNITSHPESSLLFFFIPASLIGGSYFEIKHHKKLNEILLIILTISALVFAITLKWNLI